MIKYILVNEMNFNRFCLIEAIKHAQKNDYTNMYNDLIRILYRLLDQEKICNQFLDCFFYYENVPNQTIKYYLKYQNKVLFGSD